MSSYSAAGSSRRRTSRSSPVQGSSGSSRPAHPRPRSWPGCANASAKRPRPRPASVLPALDLYEHQGKELFRAHGIQTPRGIVARSADEARAAAEELGGGAVVKVQVQIGGRGKGGGIVVAKTPDEAAAA